MPTVNLSQNLTDYDPEEAKKGPKAIRVNPGRYDANLTDAEASTSKAGYPMLVCKYKVHVDENQTPTMRDYISFSPAAAKMAADKLVALGHADAISKDFDLEELAKKMVADSRTVTVTVEDEEYQGSVSSRIQWVNYKEGVEARSTAEAFSFG